MTHIIAKFIKRFFSQYLPVQKGLAANTILAYRDAIKLLLCYASDTLHKNIEELCVEDIDESLVLHFLDHLENTRDCTARTRNARLASIRVFFGFIAREEPVLLLHCQMIRTIPLKRTQHKTVGYLEENEMQALLNAVEFNSRTGVRDEALMLLLYNTGARVSEIVGLKVTDLRLDGSAQVKLLGKGNKYRSCPLWPETVEGSVHQSILQSHNSFSMQMPHPSHDSVFGTSSANTPLQLKANAHPLPVKPSPRTPSGTQPPCIFCGQATMSIWSAGWDTPISTPHIFMWK
jgi:site-specific recombinase XerD